MSKQNNNGTEKTKNKKAETKAKEKLSGKARTKTGAKAKADIAPDISKKEVRSLLAENFSSKGTDEEVGSDHRGRGYFSHNSKYLFGPRAVMWFSL